MAKIIVKQVKSLIARPESQRKIVMALGLGRIGKTKELEDTASVRGMIAKVSHLVEVVEK
jgi:large subunit ribosomal protein L30